MTPELVRKTGWAVACLRGRNNPRPTVVVGRDTRGSGPMLEQALVQGLCAGGARVVCAGVIPTPGLAFVCRSLAANAGIVISASHNPHEDNGIKIFNQDGRKLSEAEEEALETLILDEQSSSWQDPSGWPGIGEDIADAADRYRAFLIGTVANKNVFHGMSIALDCANGATSSIAPDLFKALGSRVHAYFCQPDGTNINAGCGSEHPQGLCNRVVQTKAQIGLAFDGDGDRLVAVDETGRVLSGDQVLAICAIHLMRTGLLNPNRVVATVMSNIGLSLALAKEGIELVVTDVGDRHVMEKMVATGAVVGGENSGHMIFRDHHSTGDGLISALQLIGAMAAGAAPLSRLADLVPILPQCLVNVVVKRKPQLDTVDPIVAVIADVNRQLGEKGRVLVRYSGTQSICRVMVEGPTEEITKALCNRIAGVVQTALG